MSTGSLIASAMHTNSSEAPWGDEDWALQFIEAADELEEEALRQSFASMCRLYATEDLLEQVVGHILLHIRSTADQTSLADWIIGDGRSPATPSHHRHADYAWCWNWLDLWWDYDGVDWFPGGDFSFVALGIFFPPE